MKCIHISKSSVIFILLSTFLNNIHFTHLADNSMDVQINKDNRKNHTSISTEPLSLQNSDSILPCQDNIKCSQLNSSCLNCDYNNNCIYGSLVHVTCHSKPEVTCKEPKTFEKSFICRYCYQTEPWEHECESKANCNSVSTPRAVYRSNCTVKPNILCLGNRKFFKNVRCNWTVGYSWSTALILSVTLGGFGADRFYLGHWQEGIGKLFSFGGLGVWTLVDVILISLHYLGPADGSLYI